MSASIAINEPQPSDVARTANRHKCPSGSTLLIPADPKPGGTPMKPPSEYEKARDALIVAALIVVGIFLVFVILLAQARGERIAASGWSPLYSPECAEVHQG